MCILSIGSRKSATHLWTLLVSTAPTEDDEEEVVKRMTHQQQTPVLCFSENCL